jgi:hypothetical protein
MKLSFKDLKSIGQIMEQTLGYGKNHTSIICEMSTTKIEELFLREILKDGGYKILGRRDYLNNGPDSIEFITDIPWDQYFELTKDFPQGSPYLGEE